MSLNMSKVQQLPLFVLVRKIQKNGQIFRILGGKNSFFCPRYSEAGIASFKSSYT